MDSIGPVMLGIVFCLGLNRVAELDKNRSASFMNHVAEKQ